MRRERWPADLPFFTRTEMRMKRIIVCNNGITGQPAKRRERRSRENFRGGQMAASSNFGKRTVKLAPPREKELL